MDLLKEYCTENMLDVPEAVMAGARRIELCDNLSVGGTTPSYGTIKAAVDFAERRRVTLMTMIRPRGGGFVYSRSELEIMLQDISVARALGTNGVVIGCLQQAPEGGLEINYEQLELLMRAARNRPWTNLSALSADPHVIPVQVTFHMAFDYIAEDKQIAALEILADFGVDRILTHGGPAGTPIEDNLPRLAQLIENARPRIEIMPGGGITYKNVEDVASALGVRELHGTKIVRLV
ncbi:CutC family protein [Coriobacterium glomerans PW2]|uniref:PF03932 family protein CutC n=1 Tax=Coriobacterium glomerans (strain ATCC 49209 / DSM 20642 / JCM 10262 / PW2) TaxID=700015 RepID=F2N7B3_CORGP|nr:copper homeostasis protein CutC [Coriobacterium glomerans]AEB06588.1 CutC family protein [Coriobacterium glomerans PW2]